MTECDKCDMQAAYTRRYSGESLCTGCFADSIIRKTAKTISRYGMIRHDDLVAVAVSGGKDSLALLDIMKRMSETHHFRIKAVTIDEGIPGYRDEALGIAADFCDMLNIEHMTYSYMELYDLTLQDALEQDQSRTSSCSICGTLRRRAMDHAASEIGADAIATGHNLDDMLQTFVINMLSGDTNKIGWMDPAAASNRPRKIKPFCEIYEAEIVFYAFAAGIPFQSEPCPHAAEGIRTEIREFLNQLEDRHSGIKNNMYRSVMRVGQAVRNGEQKPGSTCKSCKARCTGDICSACSMVAGLGGENRCK